ncbi:MAG: hypothetical protein HYX92_10530 [Chloroflexi bacterium]|nr:hypothetical protein [Chloroflexota bacterium]
MAAANDYIFVLDPTAKADVPEQPMAPRLADLNGKFIGFLENNKPNADLFLHRVEELLKERFRLAGTMYRRKYRGPTSTTADAGETLINELADKCDAVVNGIGD